MPQHSREEISEDWIEFELVEIERWTVWQCARPCGKTYRHRHEFSRHLRPAICPMCSHVMRKVDSYWQDVPTTERHRIPNGGKI
jgi:uncharacterized C2H2 Zn-finger protein